MDKSAILVKRGVNKMSKRKIAAAFLAFALALSMTACGESKVSDSNSDTSSETRTTTTAATQESVQTKKTSVTTSASTDNDTETTTAQITTATGSMTGTVSDRSILEDEIELAHTDPKIKLRSLDGMYGWRMNKGSLEKRKYYEVYNYTELLTVSYTVDSFVIPVAEWQEQTTNPTGKLKYKDKDIYYIMYSNPTLEKINLYGYCEMYMPLSENNTYLRVRVNAGGELRNRNNGKGDEWIVEHSELYDDITNDASAYLFFFDAVELE